MLTGFDPWRIWPDTMHLLYLAVVPDVLGSILCDLTDGNPAQREAELDNLWESYRSWCEESGVVDRAARRLFSSATLHPKSRDYLQISQKILSAAAARYAIFWLSSLLKHLMQQHPGDLFYATSGLAGVCISLANIETIMLQGGRKHTDAEVEALKSSYMIFRSGYSKLNSAALDAGVCRWPMRPKQHYIEHFILDTLPLNGRYLHNFLSEDFIRRIKLVASKSMPAFLSKHVCLKYSLQTCLRWRG
ncbi:unnamed protein product [Symbiodinium sp. CCMP2592]|nr:unnamed protein product [Symbiodinium sp. CCMP2592]